VLDDLFANLSMYWEISPFLGFCFYINYDLASFVHSTEVIRHFHSLVDGLIYLMTPIGRILRPDLDQIAF